MQFYAATEPKTGNNQLYADYSRRSLTDYTSMRAFSGRDDYQQLYVVVSVIAPTVLLSQQGKILFALLCGVLSYRYYNFWWVILRQVFSTRLFGHFISVNNLVPSFTLR